MGKKSVITFGQVVALITTLSLALPSASQGGIYWADDFENHLTPNWDTTACGIPAPQDGCNAQISTDLAHSPSHALKSVFTSTCGNGPAGQLGCGAYYDRPHPYTREIWMRFYYFTSNFTYDGNGTKHFYHVPDNDGDPLVLWINIFSSRDLGAQVAFSPLHICPPGASNAGQLDATCNLFPTIQSKPPNDNQWYCIETHAKSDPTNGIIEVFIDGTKTLGYYNIATCGAQCSQQWHFVRQYTQHGLGTRYIDDLAVGDTRIGCSGVTTTTPSSPTAVSAQ